jgi:GTP:adenosylcobinamide-phosphate guanylyltransferase
MSNISNLNSYKEAKHLKKEIENLIIIINKHKEELEKYKRYIPVQMIQTSNLEALSILKIYLDKYNSIVKNKGTNED